MKRMLSVIILCALVLSTLSSCGGSDTTAAVKAFDREPTKVDWNAGEKEVTILKGDVYFQMKAGEKKMLYGGNPLETSGELEIVNGRAFLPMRDWAKIFGAEKILWNDETKTATLKGSYTENRGR